VRPSGHLHFDSSRCSVPERHIGKDVLVAANTRTIRVFFDSELIAEHRRAMKPREAIENPDHLGARARAYLNYTRENLLARSRAIGPAVHELACIVLSDRAVARERFVHRAVKIVIEGKSYRLDSFVNRNQLSGLTNSIS
jgi:hypothetical protein